MLRVDYYEQEHRIDSRACRETCGQGQIPSRITGRSHFMKTDLVEDILDESGRHVFCAGHDYDESGHMDAADAERFVACVNVCARLMELAEQGKLHAFQSAWEFDPFDDEADGEKLWAAIKAAFSDRHAT